MNKLFLLALTFALSLGGASAEITALNPTSATPLSNSATVTWSQTISNGTDNLLVVGCGYENAPYDASLNISSVTYNGTPLTQAVVADANTGPGTISNVSALYYLVNPTVGTFNVVVTLSAVPGNSNAIFCGSLQATGIDQSNPLGTTGSGFGFNTTSVTSTYTLGSGVDYLVVDFVDGSTGGRTETGSNGQIERDFPNGTNNSADFGYRLATGTGAATSSTWTDSGAAPARLALTTAAFQEAVPEPTGNFSLLNFSINVGTQQATLTWESESGLQYRITSSTDLSDWSQVLLNNISGESGSTTKTVSFTTGGKRFFRVEKLP